MPLSVLLTGANVSSDTDSYVLSARRPVIKEGGWFLKGEPTLSQMIRAGGFPKALHVTEMFRPSIASSFFGRPGRTFGLTGNKKQYVINISSIMLQFVYHLKLKLYRSISTFLVVETFYFNT